MNTKLVLFSVAIITLLGITYLYNRNWENANYPIKEEVDRRSVKNSRSVNLGTDTEKETDMRSGFKNGGMPFRQKIEKRILAASLIKDSKLRVENYKEIADEWAKVDSEACFNWAINLQDQNERESVLVSFVMSIMQVGDISGLKSFLDKVPLGKTKDTMIVYCMRDVAERDVGAALDIASSLSGDDKMYSASKMLISKVSEIGDETAFETIVSSFPLGRMRDYLCDAIVAELAKKDPMVALDWLKKNPDTINHDDLRAIAKAFVENNPLQGISAASEFDKENDRSKYIATVAAYWAEKDYKSAVSWFIEETNGGGFKENRNLFNEIASRSIARDQDFIFDELNSIEDESKRTSYLFKAVEYLSEYNPKKAIEIAIATSGNQDEALSVSVKNWLERDPVSASRWISELERGQARDTMVAELANNIYEVDQDYDAAIRWAMTIESEKQRLSVISRINKKKD